MFCSKCGKEISDNSKFCQFCGTNFNTENSIEHTNNMPNKNNGCLKQIGSIIGGFILLTIIYNFVFSDYTGLFDVNNGKGVHLEVTESHSCSIEYGGRAICGTVKNNSKHNLGYVQVEINLYDKAGNLVSSTLDNVNNLEANSIWKFKAPIIEDNVSTYKIKNVVGY